MCSGTATVGTSLIDSHNINSLAAAEQASYSPLLGLKSGCWNTQLGVAHQALTPYNRAAAATDATHTDQQVLPHINSASHATERYTKAHCSQLLQLHINAQQSSSTVVADCTLQCPQPDCSPPAAMLTRSGH